MKRALLVIDVQNEYLTGTKLHVTYPQNSFERILSAIDTANKNDIPVILVQHSSTGEGSKTFVRDTELWQIPEEVKSLKYNSIVEKNYPDSFRKTDLEDILKELGVDTVVICGYMTQMCCDTTARQAFHMGYKVEFLNDATGTLAFENYAGSISAEELHKAVLVIQAMKFSKVLSVNEWASKLEE